MSDWRSRRRERVVSAVLRVTWGRRIEAVSVLVATAARTACFHLGDPGVGEAAVAVAATVFAACGPTRSRLAHQLAQEKAWRVFAKRFSLLEVPQPGIGEITQVSAGPTAELWIPPGATAEDYSARSELLAVAFRARTVRITRDPADAAHGWLTVVTHDPFAGDGITWPWLNVSRTDMWKGFPIGVDEEGTDVHLELAEHHFLVGGEPGAGKSNALSLVVSAAALDPSVELWCLDAKLVELARWRDVSKAFVGPDVDEANEALEVLRREMSARYEWMLGERLRKITPESGLGLVVLVVDELALYLQEKGKARDTFSVGLRDLVARGRAAGIVVVAATQKPASDIIPTALRDLFGYRLALRCSTREASDTVLGSGWAALGHSAAEIDPGTRGVGLLLAETGVPRRLRCHVLEDADIDAIAQRALELRRPPGSWA